MDTVLFAGYPKSGNTLLGLSLREAGHLFDPQWEKQPYDIYSIRSNRNCSEISANPIFTNPAICVKTHENYRKDTSIDSIYLHPVRKIITVIRNPFDTLLSSINYIRVEFRNNGSRLSASSKRDIDMLFPGLLASDMDLNDDFFALDNLLSHNLLDSALQNFALSGTVVPSFYNMSGPWAMFVESYKYSGKPCLELRYEDLTEFGVENSSNENLLNFCNFLGVDLRLLSIGFKKQSSDAQAEKSKGNPFFAQMRSNYWREYFGLASVKSFANVYFARMIELGYEDLLDDIFKG